MQKIFEGAAINIGGSLVDMAKSAVSSIGELTVGSAINFDQAMNQFAASTGKGQAELGEYEETLKVFIPITTGILLKTLPMQWQRLLSA